MRVRDTYRCLTRASARPWVFRMTMLSMLLPAAASHAAWFDAPTPYGVDGPSVRVVAIDLDAANGPDLVAGSEEGPSFSTLRNDGTGRFTAGETVTLDPERIILRDIAAGDFDGNGRGDVAVAAFDPSVFPIRTAVVLVYSSDDSGTLMAPVEYEFPGFIPECIEAADVTHDNVLDLIVCHSDPDSGSGRVTVLPGLKSGSAPTGRFGTPANLAVGTTPANVSVADVDGDAIVDLLVGDSARGQVFVMYGTGGGRFGPPAPLAAVPAPSATRVRPGAQHNLVDVLIASVLDDTVALLAQTAPRRFAPPGRLITGHPASDMGALDLNRDGLVDLALPAPTGGTLAVWFGAAGGALTPADTLAVDEGANSLTEADFNRDGRPDLATSSFVTDRIVVALGSVAAPIPAGPGDANCDGRIDRTDLGALAARLFADGCSGADANSDGRVTTADLPRTVRLVSQLK